MDSEVISIAKELAAPIVEKKGLELFDVEYVKEGKNNFLRVYIDKEGGVDIAECGDVSEELSQQLDELDPIKEPYFLEVSSPGAERPLKTQEDFASNIEKNVYVKLYEPIGGSKEYQGTLQSFTNNIAVINYLDKTRKKQIEIPYEKIAKARIAVVF
ncbi:ribosome maturation factor RimP [Virgibacillus halophilus]|uniref:ribosome maturation factor RimP n=1 Tax=Tigheibacillus halophilus TaxID=361280 RepID=UPI003626F41D